MMDALEVILARHSYRDAICQMRCCRRICVLTRRIIAYRDKCYATQDYAAAIENILLAATALGYVSCWYEGLSRCGCHRPENGRYSWRTRRYRAGLLFALGQAGGADAGRDQERL